LERRPPGGQALIRVIGKDPPLKKGRSRGYICSGVILFKGFRRPRNKAGAAGKKGLFTVVGLSRKKRVSTTTKRGYKGGRKENFGGKSILYKSYHMPKEKLPRGFWDVITKLTKDRSTPAAPSSHGEPHAGRTLTNACQEGSGK